MADMSVHFSSATDCWATPQDLWELLDDKYGFTLDVCANSINHKTPAWYGPDHPDESMRDGLTRDWFDDAEGGTAWMNPPYGRTIGKWVRKAWEESADLQVVCLLPARTDTRWFHDYCTKGDIEFLRGRLKFGGAKNSAPFPSMIVRFAAGMEATS